MTVATLNLADSDQSDAAAVVIREREARVIAADNQDVESKGSHESNRILLDKESASKTNKEVVKKSKKPRKNAWQLPWNPMLVALMIVPVVLAVLFLGCFPQCIPFVWRPATYIVFLSMFFIFYANFLISATVNSAEDNVLKFWEESSSRSIIFPQDRCRSRDAITTKSKATANKMKRNVVVSSSVIKNNYCSICDAYVTSSAKHCGSCNKCVEHFDHHCLWLNNCVGSKNYRYFIYTLLSGILLIIIVVSCSLAMILMALLNSSKLKTWIASDSTSYKALALNNSTSELFVEPKSDNLVIFGTGVSDWLFYIYNSALLVIGAILLCFTVHLLLFHVYLQVNSMTTYDYIVEQRRKQQQTDQNNSGSLSKSNQATASNGAAIDQNRIIESSNPTAAAVKINIQDNIMPNNIHMKSQFNEKPSSQSSCSERFTNMVETHDTEDVSCDVKRDYEKMCISARSANYPPEEDESSVIMSAPELNDSVIFASGDGQEVLAPSVKLVVAKDCDKRAPHTHTDNDDDDSVDGGESSSDEVEVLNEISVHDTYNGALSNRSFTSIKMI